MQVIYILWLRQIKRYLRSKSRIVGSLGQPLLFLIALGFGFGPIYQQAGGGNYLQFLTPGIIAMSILFTALFSGIEIIWDRQFGFLKETMVAPVSRLKIMLGRTLGGATVATLQGLIVFIISMLIGFHSERPALILLTVFIMFFIALLFASLGTVIAALLKDMQGFQLIMNFLVMPIFFLSGALFPLKGLPPAIGTITRFDPLSYGVDALRGSLIVGGSHFGLLTDSIVLVLIVAALLYLGSYLFSKMQA
ncbi:MAG: ABC transporter permease [Patescibacteria group bacterium]|nr:ABC transporter permease [Patescibacteria group bacterium]MDD5121169.1 ABC transporter permease [Patescibacteria group bacterium]MDD5222021.1 ABC transporter permease [Patescibacteria group bacterium]MDD5395912.1 ABC transporter permease [Patescibacteria group bacterium]